MGSDGDLQTTSYMPEITYCTFHVRGLLQNVYINVIFANDYILLSTLLFYLKYLECIVMILAMEGYTNINRVLNISIAKQFGRTDVKGTLFRACTSIFSLSLHGLCQFY
jgi:hypothetical protein